MDKPKVSLSKIEQVIDLEQMTGVDLSDYRSLKESIGQALIDRMVSRTEDGISFTGGKLKSPYSKDYQKSLEFKAAGKSATEINMTLTGDMLASVNSEASSGSDLTLFIEASQVPKAFNHITGDTVPRRNWFGVTKKEVSEVLSDFADEISAAREASLVETDESGRTIRAIDFVRDQFNPFADDDE